MIQFYGAHLQLQLISHPLQYTLFRDEAFLD